jgi:PIN domain nuclease of toxin-antitoxin system
MLLLDTHALIWLATDLSQLTDNAKTAIRYHASDLYISSITALEVSLLVRGGKLKWGRNPHALFRRAVEHHRLAEVPVDSEIAWISAQLPPIHRDPFDRILIATAQKHKMIILTKDQIIPTYPRVKAVWE